MAARSRRDWTCFQASAKSRSVVTNMRAGIVSKSVNRRRQIDVYARSPNAEASPLTTRRCRSVATSVEQKKMASPLSTATGPNPWRASGKEGGAGLAEKCLN